MASDPFTIAINQVVAMTAIPVTGNGKFLAFVSTPTNHTQSKNSFRLHAQFNGFLPDPLAVGASPGWSLRAVVESSDGQGHWFPIATQFEPLRNPLQGSTQIMVVQPTIFNPDEGIPVDVWDGQAVVARVNRQQGVLGIDFRVKVELIETRYGTADALQSFTLSLFGDRYDG